MKKWLSILALSTVFALAGCGGEGTSESGSDNPSSIQQSSPLDSTEGNDPNHTHANNNGDGFCDGCGASILTTLNIFSRNDLPGKFADTDQNCGVDEMTTFLRNQQQANPNTILLSAGDMWQGSPESNLTYGNIITEWMNDLGFVSMALGNHEYDWGEEYIQQNADLANFPILGINVFDPDTNEREEYASPSVMIERSGVKIGIIGAIGDCMSSIAADKAEDVYFKTGSELTQLIKDESTSLRQQGADIIIYSLHDSGDAYGSYYDEQLSNGYVDLVFEGHSHQEVRRKDSYGVWHLQAGGDNGTGLSHAEIKIDIISGNITVAQTKIVSHSAYLHLDDDPIVNALMGGLVNYKTGKWDAFSPLTLYQLHKCGLICCAEVGRTRNQNRCTVFLANRMGVAVYAAVHFNQAIGIDVVHPLPQLFDLGHHVCHELLAAETGFYGHNKDHVTLFQIGNSSLCGSFGFEHDTGLAAEGMNFVQCFQRVLRLVGFNVDGHKVSTCLDKLLHVPDGAVDHQMNIQRQIGNLTDGGNHRNADGDIGNKNAVHHVNMDKVCAEVTQSTDIPLQIYKVGRQNGRGNFRHNKVLLYTLLF